MVCEFWYLAFRRCLSATGGFSTEGQYFCQQQSSNNLSATAPIHEGAGVLEAYQSSGSLADALTWVWTNSHSCFWQRETHPGRLMRGIGALETITDSQAQLAKSKMSLWPVLPSGI
jgi:hypothetical protein